MLAPSVQLLTDLFEASPNVYFCVKDTDGRYLAVSEMFVRRWERRRHELIGMTVDDFCPPDLARLYRAEDRALLVSGRTPVNHLEAVADASGQRHWFLTSRALHKAEGFDDVIVAISTPTDLGGRAGQLGDGLRRAIELAERSDRGALRVSDLAEEAGLTTDQLDRAMRRVLGVSPKQHLMAIRADRAASMLATTGAGLADIARACHYYDQSQFTTCFKDVYGLTPSQFRSTIAEHAAT
ncbi:MAG: helix-turn-helix domain-containing protein [Actinomycetia bacterium]|nr:helix-turn-helix domain-containing protein [Actinomycetes bacterium]MCP4958167.1 helix-turn-helix domain-containing protein [Actinomycetes bacterium]